MRYVFIVDFFVVVRFQLSCLYRNLGQRRKESELRKPALETKMKMRTMTMKTKVLLRKVVVKTSERSSKIRS